MFKGWQDVSWKNILALLVFAYRLAIAVVKNGQTNFVKQVIAFVCQIIAGKIAAWIAGEGGWVSVDGVAFGVGSVAI